MNRFALFILCFSFLNCTFADEELGFTEYETKIEVPEPLFFDLVRGLSASKGEWEVNTLLHHTEGNFDQLHWAPELEWVFRKNMAFEIELPMMGSSLQNYKAAFQTTLYQDYESASIHGLQFIYEAHKDWRYTEATALYIYAHRFNHEWSMISLMGVRTILEEFHGLAWLFNHSFFYNYSREIDLGLEVNMASKELGHAFKQVVPQVHLTMGERYKLQFGVGGREVDKQWSPVAILRWIREFNK